VLYSRALSTAGGDRRRGGSGVKSLQNWWPKALDKRGTLWYSLVRCARGGWQMPRVGENRKLVSCRWHSPERTCFGRRRQPGRKRKGRRKSGENALFKMP